MKKQYATPQVKVVKTTVRHQMLAGSVFNAPAKASSDEGTEQYGNGSTDSWFN